MTKLLLAIVQTSFFRYNFSSKNLKFWYIFFKLNSPIFTIWWFEVEVSQREFWPFLEGVELPFANQPLKASNSPSPSALPLSSFYHQIRCEIRCRTFRVICSEIKWFDLQGSNAPSRCFALKYAAWIQIEDKLESTESWPELQIRDWGLVLL